MKYLEINPLASLYDLIVCLVVYSLFVPALHEAGHWLITRIYGGDGYIQLGFPTSYFYLTREPTPFGSWLSGFAGVLVVFFYLLILSREDELEERLGLLPPIIQQTVYGVGEGIWAISGGSWDVIEAIKALSLLLYVVFVVVAFVVWAWVLTHSRECDNDGD